MTITRPRLLTLACAVALGLGAWTAAPSDADAFCGFYVAGADTELFNDATMVVLMRDGERTVLAMQNSYQGPPENFALVIPVPVVLSEDDVKTLPPEVFDRVDKLAAPRLVEYWEQDPCAPPVEYSNRPSKSGGVVFDEPSPEVTEKQYGVRIEAQFEVGEYDIVILSASDSTGLDSWLRDNDYQIPAGAEPLLRPYVEGGSKFFVAKVDVSKVKFESRPNGQSQAKLSPLRFHYDSDQFALPIRLGLINAPAGKAGGAQDLLVHILARNTRYQVANYPNVTIPTNLDVKDQTRDHFGQFYVSLFDHTLAQGVGGNQAAVVTEYAWSAASCDPCPQPPLELQELVTLGADVLPAYAGKLTGDQIDADLEWSVPSEFVLTRLHARYDSSSLGEDLVFEEAPAIAGGREFMQQDGQLERGAQPSSTNQFQARYIIRHPWTGKIACPNPQRGIWGGPPSGQAPGPTVARELARVDRSAKLSSFVTAKSQALLGVAAVGDDEGDGDDAGADAGEAGAPTPEPTPTGEQPDASAEPADPKAAGEAGKTDGKADQKGCRCQATSAPAGRLGFGLLALLTLAGIRRRPRSRIQIQAPPNHV